MERLHELTERLRREPDRDLHLGCTWRGFRRAPPNARIRSFLL